MDKSQETIKNLKKPDPASDSGSDSSSSSSSSSNNSQKPAQDISPTQTPTTTTKKVKKPSLRKQSSTGNNSTQESSHHTHRSRRSRRRANTRTRRPPNFMEDTDSINEEIAVLDPNQASVLGGTSNLGVPGERRASNFYSVRHPKHAQNLSATSLESNALLDHREQQYMRPRRASTMVSTPPIPRSNLRHSQGITNSHSHTPSHMRRGQPSPRDEHSPVDLRRGPTGDYASDSEVDPSDRSPLLSRTPGDSSSYFARTGRPASTSSKGSRKQKQVATNYGSVNNPPSMPTSPNLDPRTPNFDHSDDEFNGMRNRNHELLISIDTQMDEDPESYFPSSKPTTPPGSKTRNMFDAEEDVCFPVDDDVTDGMGTPQQGDSRRRRRRARPWPDLSVLEDWSREEKEERSEGIRAKKYVEPVMVGGRLRPNMRAWHREVEDLPYRFTYFNDELPSTIHSQTISELVTPGQTTFRDLFLPDFIKYSDDECSSDEERITPKQNGHGDDGMTRHSTRSDLLSIDTPQRASSIGPAGPEFKKDRDNVSIKDGERPTWWLDILSPTKAEMKVLQDAFGIHPLTAEDILMQEAREKVELFRNYYLVSYRTFEQDPNDENYMEPVNFYIIVFREGVLSFHFSMTPHGANVRRRIRQLKDYLNISSDWISYAIIDNITDAFAPLIQSIEDEVDTIDDVILDVPDATPEEKNKQSGDDDDKEYDDAHMLRRIATCRKKVMSLYRLLGNKADVIKGFSKRCNEQWEVAPRSEIGLYLGDIQDHIVTMVANLVHVEKILSRGHSNYLAQISIKMNARQEETADTLGKLTVLGTIVLPMNIITGLWGMNVLVPGQGADSSLTWFWSITGGLLIFGCFCYLLAKRVYGLV